MFGTHLKVESIPGPAYGPLAATLYQEKQGGQPASTDVYTSTAVQLTPYLDKGLFRSVDWVALMPSRIAPAFVEGGGQGLRYSNSQPGILYNPKAAPWVPEIAVAADLLKPQYKGKFYTTPFLGGFDVLLADDVWGEAKTEAYVRKLSPQLAGLVGCEATDRIATGEIPALAIDCGGGGPNQIQYRGRGVLANHVISDMAEDRYGYLSIRSMPRTPMPEFSTRSISCRRKASSACVGIWVAAISTRFPIRAAGATPKRSPPRA